MKFTYKPLLNKVSCILYLIAYALLVCVLFTWHLTNVIIPTVSFWDDPD